MIVTYIAYIFFSVTPITGSEDFDIIWRSERVCALNSLYFLLTLSGHDPDYLQMQRVLLKKDLASLEDIRVSANSYGLNVRVAFLTPQELRSLEVPVIAHFDKVEISGLSRGHFVVVFETDDKGVHYLDGTTAEIYQVPWREFERNWSGYIAYSYEPEPTRWLLIILSLASGVVCGYLVMYRRKNPLKVN